MTVCVFFRGKKITQAERALLAKAFGETIDDMQVCHTVLIRAMQKEKALERSAITKTLQGKTVSYAEGGRVVKRLIRAVRHDLGYRDPLRERVLYGWDRLVTFPYTKAMLHIFYALLDLIHAFFRVMRS